MISLFRHFKLLAVIVFLCSLKHILLLFYIYAKHGVWYWADDAFTDIFWGSFWLYLALSIRNLISSKNRGDKA